MASRTVSVTRTSQGYEVSAIIGGRRVHKHYIGYTKKEAVAEFKHEFYPRRNTMTRKDFQVIADALGVASEYAFRKQTDGPETFKLTAETIMSFLKSEYPRFNKEIFRKAVSKAAHSAKAELRI